MSTGLGSSQVTTGSSVHWCLALAQFILCLCWFTLRSYGAVGGGVGVGAERGRGEGRAGSGEEPSPTLGQAVTIQGPAPGLPPVPAVCVLIALEKAG